MDATAIIAALIAAFLGGGGVAIYRARAERHKTLAETRQTSVATDVAIVGEAVRTAQGFAEIATSLVQPLQEQITAGQAERTQLRVELGDQKAEQARLTERMGALEALEAECREDRAALRRQLGQVERRRV